MGKVKEIVPRKSTRNIKHKEAARPHIAKKQPKGAAKRKSPAQEASRPQIAKKQPKGAAKRTSTATPRPGLYGNSGMNSVGPSTSVSSNGIKDFATSKACTPNPGNVVSSTRVHVQNNDGEQPLKMKLVMKKVRSPLPKRPDPNMNMDDKLDFHGLNDHQINGFLAKTGFKDVVDGYGCAKGKVVVLKAGYFRLFLTTDLEHYAMPSSMTRLDWKQFSAYRQHGLNVFIFLTREFCQKEFVLGLKGNANIPTETMIRKKYAYEEEKDSAGVKVGWKYKDSHTALLHIKGTTVQLFDVNNSDDTDWTNPANQFVQDFYAAVNNFVLPKLAKEFTLDLEDVRRGFMIPRCCFSLAVDNSCALYLLFLVEQFAVDGIIWDVNWTPALSQLYCHKVVHHVGGGEEDFNTFARKNPDWLTIVRPFLFEPLLNDLKTGIEMSLAELSSEMERIDADLEYVIEW